MEGAFQIQRILFPTDFSKNSEAAAAYVAGLARAMNAEVSLLHVVPSISEWRGVSESYYNEIGPEAMQALLANQKAAVNASAQALESLRKTHFERLSAEASVKSGGVAATIVEYADEMNADLIMMTTRGLGPLRRFLIGSATAKVLHDTSRPLWTTPHIAEIGVYQQYRHIVCATDYRVLSRDLLLRAVRVVQRFQARLTVVSAIPRPAASDSSGVSQASLQEIRRQTEAVLKKNLAELNIDASIDILDGSVGHVVRRAAVFAEADLIVIGHGHLGEQMGHLRTHAYEIIWNAPCPVLAI